MSFRESSSREK